MALMLRSAVKTIVVAEDAGVRQIWMVQPPNLPDVLTTFAAAAAKTSTINLGTSIVPTYPRHPLVLAQQATSFTRYSTWSIETRNWPQSSLHCRKYVWIATQ